jgi:hypothetical protein
MKVTRATEFTPITLTLESLEEADALWHIFNNGHHTTLSSYCESRGGLEGFTETFYRFFSDYDDVHIPAGEQ